MEPYQREEVWWERSSGAVRYSLKNKGLTIRDVIEQLSEVVAWGFDAIELFAPYHGGDEYGGLDFVDLYRIDPAIGTMDDFEELVRHAHNCNIKVIAFVNLGYSAEHCPAFLKACDDIRAGIDSPESHWYVWSDTGEATFDRGLVPYFLNDADGYWQYSERAGKYYWVKWKGIGGKAKLPQVNFGDPLWQQECKRAVRFWMERGIDGMIIDAVNWYIHCNWDINNETMTDVIGRYSNCYVQPEGAGGFGDDPVPWILQGRYNSVQDYGLNIWWNGHDAIGLALASGNPSGIELALQGYRDKVVEAGGVTYIGPHWGRKSTVEERLLELATISGVGEFLHDDGILFKLEWTELQKESARQLIRIKRDYSALHPACRRELVTAGEDGIYSFIRESKDGMQRVLVILNYSDQEREWSVTLDRASKARNLLNGESITLGGTLDVSVGAYGYLFVELG